MIWQGVTGYIILSSYLLISPVWGLTGLQTTCYVLDGQSTKDAGYRCDNNTRGPSACCGAGAVCYSNGLCKQDNVGVVDYLRVGCTDSTFKAAACLDQCTTFANSSTAGVRFCGGDITKTTSYCCDDGSNGAGSFACCSTASNIFQIQPAATVLAQMPLSQLSTTSTSTRTSATSSSTSTSSSPAATTTPSSSSSSSHSAAIGAGIGVPLGLLALAALAYFLFRRRKNQRKKATQTYELQNEQGPYSGNYGGGGGVYQDRTSPLLSEVDATPAKKGYFGQGSGGVHELQQPPSELPNTQRGVVHEMGA